MLEEVFEQSTWLARDIVLGVMSFEAMRSDKYLGQSAVIGSHGVMDWVKIQNLVIKETSLSDT